jgi:hypothetical protein
MKNSWLDKYSEEISKAQLGRNISILDAQISPEYIQSMDGMVKSAVGNNGMFDMTNPNIYKSVLPLTLGATAATQLGQEEPPQYKQGGVIKDNNGYWNPDNWGKPVEINSNRITMKGVNQPLLGISDTGNTQMMYPEEEYEFVGNKVTEYPLALNGININKQSKNWLDKYNNEDVYGEQEIEKAKDGKELVNLNQLTNFTNYNKPTVGGWLNKYSS